MDVSARSAEAVVARKLTLVAAHAAIGKHCEDESGDEKEHAACPDELCTGIPTVTTKPQATAEPASRRIDTRVRVICRRRLRYMKMLSNSSTAMHTLTMSSTGVSFTNTLVAVPSTAVDCAKGVRQKMHISATAMSSRRVWMRWICIMNI